MLVALALAGCTGGGSKGGGTPATPSALEYGSATVNAVMQKAVTSAEWSAGRWGLLAADPSGRVLDQVNPHDRFLTGSVAKVFSVTAALHILGPDHRFTTPVVHTGSVDAAGTLTGDLIMVGSGDLTLGGRTRPDGTVDFTDFDHFDANALPGVATLTPEDPLAGLDQLARQVARSGVRHVKGDVVVDARLWDPVTIDHVPITPTVVNDNLVDLMVTPGSPGGAAGLDWRPRTAAFQVTGHLTTGAAGSAPEVTVSSPAPGRIEVSGQVPAGVQPTPFIATYQVPDPAAFARTLLVEALVRQGVSVDAAPAGANPAGRLPSAADVAKLPQAAVYTSPPFSEYAKLINKISHNLGANLLPPLMAVTEGKRTYDDGMAVERAFVERAGIRPGALTLTDGQGLPGNKVTPDAVVQYLRFAEGLPEFKVFFGSMPSVGVDGSLKNAVPATDPAVGHIRAKTGTLVGGSNDALVMQTKALAGYVDAPGGKLLPFAIFLNDVPIKEINDVIKANSTIGEMASSLYTSPS